MNSDDIPGNWHWGGGSASRPLADGGYYDRRAYRVLPGSNQHIERYLECHVWAEQDRHVVEISEREEDDMETREVKRLENYRWRVDPQTEDEHDRVETKAMLWAVDKMDEYADYRP